MWRIEKPTSEGNNANHDKRESHEYKVYIYSTSSFVLERTRRVFFLIFREIKIVNTFEVDLT